MNRVGSQHYRIRKHLSKVGHITQHEALLQHGIPRLAARILELREQGEVIETTILRDVNGNKFASYSYGTKPTATQVAASYAGAR